ncbi:MAG: major capsid protein [Pseudomonadota bacterium]|nr:major capsid protein [Pseudomonadota bacterium]
MATTQLADIIEPKIFEERVVEETTRLDLFVQSGIVMSSDVFDRRANGEGDITDLPFWNDLGNGESNVQTDDPAVKSTPDKIGMGKQIAFRNHREKDWSSMDIVANVLGQDPLDVIAGRVGKYWVGDRQKMLFSMVNGLIADNVAANSGDMIHNVATDAAGAPADAEKINPNTVLEASQTMGDAAKLLRAIAMPSRLYTNLKKSQAADFLTVSAGMKDVDGSDLTYETYLGYRLFIDDDMPIAVGANRTTYTVVLFGPGAFALGQGTPKVPVEVWRDPSAGRGAGEERLYSRRQFILHPKGYQCTAANASGKSPTNAEYAVAGAWVRVLERKKIPLAFLKVNG